MEGYKENVAKWKSCITFYRLEVNLFYSPKSYNLFPDFPIFTKCFPISALNKLLAF